MEIKYEIMDSLLNIDKDIMSVKYIISRVEGHLSEEDNREEKYLANATLLMLTDIEHKIKSTLKEIDENIVGHE